MSEEEIKILFKIFLILFTSINIFLLGFCIGLNLNIWREDYED